LAELGNSEDAIRHWDEALRIKPDCVEAYYDLGVASQRADRLAEAVEYYEQALRLKPDYVEAHNNLGLALAGWAGTRSAEALRGSAEDQARSR